MSIACSSTACESISSRVSTTGALESTAIEPESVATYRTQITAQIDGLFEQTRLACDVRDAELLESILRELTLLNDIRVDLEGR